MDKIPPCRVLFAASVLCLVVQAAVASTVVVGTCLPHHQSYSTISQAVSSVSAGSTIFVCPGQYPEQVTIIQPLTLKGVPSANTSNPTIIVPAGGLTKSVISPTNGVTMYFQILVQGTQSGTVNISNLTVNGRSSANKNLNGWIEGIYYQNSSGTISNVAAYSQSGNGAGFGIFLEGTTSPAKTVTVKNNSVHDFDSEGIRTNGSGAPNLTVNITSNSVIHSNAFTGNPAYGGIDIQGAEGTVSNNRVITHPAAPGVSRRHGDRGTFIVGREGKHGGKFFGRHMDAGEFQFREDKPGVAGGLGDRHQRECQRCRKQFVAESQWRCGHLL